MFPTHRSAAPGPHVHPPRGLEGRLQGGRTLSRKGCHQGHGARTCLGRARELKAQRGAGRPWKAGSPRQTPWDAHYSPSAVAIFLGGLGVVAALGREAGFWKRVLVREAHGAGKGGAAQTHPRRCRVTQRARSGSGRAPTTPAGTPGPRRTERNFNSRSERFPRGFPPRRRSNADRHPPPLPAGAVPGKAKSGAH